MKYIKLFENFEEYDIYELMITTPNKKAEMIMKEIKKSEPNLNLVQDLITMGADINWYDEKDYNQKWMVCVTQQGKIYGLCAYDCTI